MPPRKSAASKRATPASKKSHKRQLSQVTPSISPGSRVSKRLKESAEKDQRRGKTTPTKSKYFQEPDSEDEDVDIKEDESEESGYEDQEASETDQPSTEEPDTEDDYESDEEHKRRKPKKKTVKSGGGLTGGIQAVANAVLEQGKELWRPGVKTGLGPGKQVFIEKPKPRDDGGIKYAAEKIHPNTMAFLKDLKENNDREWLKMHDVDYRASWKDWEGFVEALTEKLTEIDETIPELPPKDVVFRIYRDIRFSSDPTPYKPHFSAAWSRTGRKGPYACYYVHIEPGGKSIVGSGLWMPESQPLALLRANIDRKPEKLRRVLTEPQLRKQILGVASNDEKKAVKAFADHNKENALKTKPKGYDADNPNIDLLRLRCFTLGKRIPDEKVVGEQGLQTILELIRPMVPFVSPPLCLPFVPIRAHCEPGPPAGCYHKEF
ncbi:hypothetical protein AYO21_07885 [Fonsecaea monophora]|uniref:TIGR02453 family protein n=1 Tax=Fonsecaea monophora TaxID=254056 RepID=A0A177F0V3_9EURO|nr:hypothetical protein AYO21_07885 [Fonsecaea monophora]OAG37913.1 hypothetical protein AYO21_07885 [Fonsecaea monophora]